MYKFIQQTKKLKPNEMREYNVSTCCYGNEKNLFLQTPKLSPFERRLMKEVELRDHSSSPLMGPTGDQV